MTDTTAAAPMTLVDLRRLCERGEKIACLTAYDASFAALEDQAGVELVLVGDSLGMVVQGRDSTVPVTMDEMVYHSRCTLRGLRRAFPLVDLPFLSYPDPPRALDNAARLMQDGGARMVKLEGDERQAEIVAHLTSNGIPVCAHVGLLPQRVHKMGGFRLQGTDDASTEASLRAARVLEEAGADLLLVECVPAALGARLAEQAGVPVIGIGAGPHVHGQILVLYDVLGITPGRVPRFARRYLTGRETIQDALKTYVTSVKEGVFPAPEHTFYPTA